MIWGTLGTLSFLLFFIYDINSVRGKNKFLHYLFGIGCSLLLISTVGLIIQNFSLTAIKEIKSAIFIGLTIVCLVLLIYTLFFALPFKETYVESRELPKVYDQGIYALCRHPGVLWFFFVYIFIGLAMQSKEVVLVGLLLSFWNLLYIIFQDNYTFLKSFSNYREYKDKTPFLIPNKNSLRRCIRTFHPEGK